MLGPKEWCPLKAKRSPGLYPQTPEEYPAYIERCRENIRAKLASGKMTRAGVRDGWAGKKKLAQQIRTRAETRAKVIVEIMKDKGIVTLDDERAEKALTFAVTLIEDITERKDLRLTATRTVLDFCKAKPASRTQLEVLKPEDFLAALVAQGPTE